jgi:hypothetical protein
VWAEAKNQSITSPTRISKIGDRYTEFTSAFVQTTAQAQTLADSYLAVHSLEEFELSFETLMLPWLEVGDIIGWVDPNPAPDDPDTFLLSSLNLPLSLSPMSGLGRRVSLVQDTSSLNIGPTMTWDQLPDNITWDELPLGVTWDEI